MADTPSVIIAGSLRAIVIPEMLWCEDPQEFVRALLAWQFGLSRQEINILEFLVQGLGDADIAEKMRSAGINTVKKLVRSVLNKLGARNRTQAAVLAARCGLSAISNQVPHPNG